ncbi:hypothetical protein [Nonomuraea sp. NPDC049784]|uniref:hypothetical protein n=1 Tax=Nonomuraea sp. NPDC049784 TaxID=3154361 RepID=UPI0033EB3DAA
MIAVPVGPGDTATDLFHRTVDLIAPIVAEALDLIASGHTGWTPQDRSKASFFHKRSIEDSNIDWTWPAEDIERLVRAQSDPYPKAFTHYKGECIRILKASVSKGHLRWHPGPGVHPRGRRHRYRRRRRGPPWPQPRPGDRTGPHPGRGRPAVR